MANSPAERGPSGTGHDTARCPKCASDEVMTRYHRARFLCNPHSRYTNNDQEGEHLHHTCRHCGYDWTGDVADA